jgi:Reverse transcriptase (RNA-dependent DNA polymerase)
MLETNPYVIVIAVDFSKAFDSVRPSTLLQKYASLELQDNIYNWIESYFQHRSHSKTFRGQFSSQEEVTSSIVQGSSIGPASYVVIAADLHPLSPANAMIKFADDTYQIVAASNVNSCQTEVDHIEGWAKDNNLVLNRSKSAELIIKSKSRLCCRTSTSCSRVHESGEAQSSRSDC